MPNPYPIRIQGSDGVATLNGQATFTDPGNQPGDGGSSSALAIKDPCIVAAWGQTTLFGEQTIDFYTTQPGDRVLVMFQEDPTENGIYVAGAGAWTRAADADAEGDFTDGALIPVGIGGNASSRSVWSVTVLAPPWVPGTSDDLFAVMIAGAGMSAAHSIDGGNTLVNPVNGIVFVNSVHSTDPHVAGVVWSNNGTLVVSSG